MDKNCVIFVIKKLYFAKLSDLDFEFLKLFGLGLIFKNSGLDLDRKI